MKSYQLGIYEKAMPNTMTLEEKLLCAKEFGYDYLEMSIDETEQKLARLDSSKAERAEMVSTMFKTGVPVRSICLSGHRKYPLGSSNAGIVARSLEIMEKAIVFACDLGVRIIQLAGYDVYYEPSTKETQERFGNNLQKCVDLASKYGIILAFETMETPFMDNVKKAMHYVNKIDSPYLKVYPDIGNCMNASLVYGDDILQDLQSGKGCIAAVHLKETVPGKFREIEYGTGHVDFEAAVRTSLQLGVKMFVTEFWDTAEREYHDRIAYSKKFIDEIFEKVN